MLNYRNKFDDPTPAGRARRGARRLLRPLVWFAVGIFIVGVLLVVWIMPLAPGLDPISWLGQVLGLGPRRQTFMPVISDQLRPLLVLPVVLGVLGLASLAATLHVYRRRMAVAVLGHLDAAVGLRVPLPAYLRAAADAERPGMRKRLNRLAAQVAGGRPLGAALGDVAGELPPLAIDRIAAAERAFSLNDSLALVVQRERRRAAMPDPAGGSGAYALLLLTTVFSVTSMIMIFVMPKFAQIFADFKLQFPPVTTALIRSVRWLTSVLDASDAATALFVIIVGPLVMLVLAATLTRSTRGLFTSRPVRRLTQPVIDRVVWYMPFFGRMTRDGHAALACETLAEALLVGRPLPEAIASSTLPGLNAVLRRRMRDWQTRVAAGAPVADAARAAKLPPLWCDMLAGAHADLPAAVAFVARAYNAHWRRRSVAVRAVLPVLLTFAMAAVVAFVALALFTPLVTLIESISFLPRRR